MKGKGSGRLLLSNGFGDVNKIAMEKEKERGKGSLCLSLSLNPYYLVSLCKFKSDLEKCHTGRTYPV